MVGAQLSHHEAEKPATRATSATASRDRLQSPSPLFGFPSIEPSARGSSCFTLLFPLSCIRSSIISRVLSRLHGGVVCSVAHSDMKQKHCSACNLSNHPHLHTYDGKYRKTTTSHEQSDTVSTCRGLITSMTNSLFTKHMDATRPSALSRNRAACLCRKTALSLQFTPARRRATRFRWRSEEMSCRVVPPHTIIQYLHLPFPRLPRPLVPG